MPYSGPKDGLMGVHLSRTVLLFTVLVGHSAAVRLLVPEAAPCGEFLTETDVPGPTLTTVADTADDQACLTACRNTEGCNVAIRMNSNGGCFLKGVDASTVEPFTATAFTSHIICDADIGAGGPVPPANVCNTYLTGQDILGPNIKSQGSTADNAACLALCESTTGCNAMVRVNANGGCFLKTVDADNLDIIDVPWLTSYLICDGSGGDGTTPPPPAPTPPPPAPTPPPPAPTPPPPAPSGNPWRDLKPIPVPLGEVAADVMSVDGKDYLLVFGGTRPDEPKNGLSFIYDFAEDVWIEGGPRPKNGDHHNVEVMGNKLYMFGGLGGGSTGELQIGTLSAAPGNQVSLTWENGPTSPLFTGSGNTAVMDGKALFCGGILAGSEGSTTIPDCEAYDPVTNSWLPPDQTPPDMIGGRNHAASCTDGSRFYVFGGRMRGNGETPGFSETQIYTPGGSWTLGAPLPLARGGMGSCACTGGKCYVFGGEVPRTDPPSLALKIDEQHTVYRVDIYDIASNSWSLGTDMPKGMHGIYPVLHDGKIYLAGGGIRVGPSFSRNFFEYTPE